MINVRRIRRECRKAKGNCPACRYGFSLGVNAICGIKSELTLGAMTKKPMDWEIARTEKFIKERNDWVMEE